MLLSSVEQPVLHVARLYFLLKEETNKKAKHMLTKKIYEIKKSKKK